MNHKMMIFRCIEIEFKKIIFRKKYQLILGMIMLLPIVCLIIYNIPGSGIFFTMSNLPYTVLSVSAYLLIPMLSFMIASDFFAGEEERGELKIILTKPISRTAITLSKFTAMLLYVAMSLLILMVLSSLITIFSVGFETVNLLSIMLSYSLTLIPSIMICSFASMLATLSHTSTASFLFCLLTYLGVVVTGLVFSGITSLLFTNYSAIFKMIIGTNIPFGQLLTGIGILLGYGMIFMSAQIILFNKKEN